MGDVVEAPLRGNEGIHLTLTLGEDTVEYDGNIKNVQITNEDKEDLTFAEVASGDVKDFLLVITGIQSLAEGSLWRLLWDNPGAVFDCEYGPYGNAVATSVAPHFVGQVKATGRPQSGKEAKTAREREEFEYELRWEETPELDEGV